MYAETAEEPGQPAKTKPRAVCAQDEIPIQGEIKGLIETAQPLPNAAAPEHCFLRDEVHPSYYLRIVPGENDASDLLVKSIDADSMPVYDINIRMIGKEAGDISQCSGQQQIVTVEPAHEVALCACEPEIDRLRLAFVVFTHPREPIFIFSQQRMSFVARVAILHGVMQRRILLTKNRANGALNVFCLIQARRDDCDRGRVGWQINREIMLGDFPFSWRILIKSEQRRTKPGAPAFIFIEPTT